MGTISNLRINCFCIITLLILSVTIAAQSRGKKKSKQSHNHGSQIQVLDFGEVTTPNVGGRRDLSKYNDGGNFDLRTYLLGDKRGKHDIDELIGFIVMN